MNEVFLFGSLCTLYSLAHSSNTMFLVLPETPLGQKKGKAISTLLSPCCVTCSSEGVFCVWCRNYSVVNVEKGQVEVKRMSCAGSRISCQMKMGNILWMATEVHTTWITSTISTQTRVFNVPSHRADVQRLQSVMEVCFKPFAESTKQWEQLVCRVSNLLVCLFDRTRRFSSTVWRTCVLSVNPRNSSPVQPSSPACSLSQRENRWAHTCVHTHGTVIYVHNSVVLSRATVCDCVVIAEYIQNRKPQGSTVNTCVVLIEYLYELNIICCTKRNQINPLEQEKLHHVVKIFSHPVARSTF